MVASTQPASTIMVLLTGSSERIRRMRVSATMTGGLPCPDGVAPPHRLVFPPCGGTGVSCAMQRRTMAATCSVVDGSTTQSAGARKRPRQSSVRPARSSSRVSTAVSPSNCLNASINALTSLRDGPTLSQTASAQVIAIRLLQSHYANYEFGTTGSQARGSASPHLTQSCPAKAKAVTAGSEVSIERPRRTGSSAQCASAYKADDDSGEEWKAWRQRKRPGLLPAFRRYEACVTGARRAWAGSPATT